MKTASSIFVIIIITLSFISCSNRSELLQIAESVMYQRPDSALQILNSIQHPENFTGKEQADYCLLLTQARDKNYIEHENDSLIDIAITYYENTNDNEKKALSYFYKAVYYYDNKDFPNATRYYKMAEDLGIRTENLELIGLIYNHLGLVNKEQRLIEKSLFYYKKALLYAKIIGNSSRILNNSQEVAKAFILLNEPDSTDYYFMESFQLIDSVNTSIQANAYHNMGVFYQMNGQPDKAIPYLYNAAVLKPKSESKFRTYAILADTYDHLNDFENSKIYWDKSIQSNNIYTNKFIYHCLFNKSIEEGNHDNVIEYAEKYIAYSDSINKVEIARDILEIQEKYDNEQLRTRQLEYELYIFRLCFALAALLLILILTILLYKRYNKKQKKHFIEKIQAKEAELKIYRATLSELENRISSGTLVNDSLLNQHAVLLDKIKHHEKEIERYKSRLNLNTANDEQSDITKSVKRGIRLYAALNPDNERMHLLTTTDFTDIIRFYKIYDEPFISFLMKEEFHLTTLERIICILFRMKLSHKQVAECLGNTSATLARSKTRIKKKKIGLTDECRLEDYINFVAVEKES